MAHFDFARYAGRLRAQPTAREQFYALVEAPDAGRSPPPPPAACCGFGHGGRQRVALMNSLYMRAPPPSRL